MEGPVVSASVLPARFEPAFSLFDFVPSFNHQGTLTSHSAEIHSRPSFIRFVQGLIQFLGLCLPSIILFVYCSSPFLFLRYCDRGCRNRASGVLIRGRFSLPTNPKTWNQPTPATGSE